PGIAPDRQICRFAPRLPPQIWKRLRAESYVLPSLKTLNPATSIPKQSSLEFLRVGVVEGCHLLAIQLHDQLFLHWKVDLLAGRERRNPAGHLAGIERQPLGDAASFHFFHRMLNGGVLRARAAHRDDVAGLDRV